MYTEKLHHMMQLNSDSAAKALSKLAATLPAENQRLLLNLFIDHHFTDFISKMPSTNRLYSLNLIFASLSAENQRLLLNAFINHHLAQFINETKPHHRAHYLNILFTTLAAENHLLLLDAFIDHHLTQFISELSTHALEYYLVQLFAVHSVENKSLLLQALLANYFDLLAETPHLLNKLFARLAEHRFTEYAEILQQGPEATVRYFEQVCIEQINQTAELVYSHTKLPRDMAALTASYTGDRFFHPDKRVADHEADSGLTSTCH